MCSHHYHRSSHFSQITHGCYHNLHFPALFIPIKKKAKDVRLKRMVCWGSNIDTCNRNFKVLTNDNS
uniref:Uncharacterized protein n=1 Tax=Brugia malayi TaxID=6279 RepID=A8NQ60_BRUMA